MSKKPSDSDSATPADANTKPVEAEVKAVAEAPSDSTVHVELPTSTFWRDLIWATPSWLVSMIVHVILLLALAMLYLPPNVVDEARDLLLATGDDDVLEELDDFEEEPLDSLDVVSPDAAMVLEWIRRKDRTFSKELKDYLFTDKAIAHA